MYLSNFCNLSIQIKRIKHNANQMYCKIRFFWISSTNELPKYLSEKIILNYFTFINLTSSMQNTLSFPAHHKSFNGIFSWSINGILNRNSRSPLEGIHSFWRTDQPSSWTHKPRAQCRAEQLLCSYDSEGEPNTSLLSFNEK